MQGAEEFKRFQKEVRRQYDWLIKQGYSIVIESDPPTMTPAVLIEDHYVSTITLKYRLRVIHPGSED